MFDQHATFRQELHRIVRFADKVDKHRGQMAIDRSEPSAEDVLQHASVAFEDIPEDMHESVRMILMHPTEATSLRDQVRDVAVNAVGKGWGDIEEVARRLSCLQMLSRLGHHVPYT